MTDKRSSRKSRPDEEQEQADLELDEEQTDEVKGGGRLRFGTPQKSGPDKQASGLKPEPDCRSGKEGADDD